MVKQRVFQLKNQNVYFIVKLNTLNEDFSRTKPLPEIDNRHKNKKYLFKDNRNAIFNFF